METPAPDDGPGESAHTLDDGPKTTPAIVPWADRKESLAEIKRIVDMLVPFSNQAQRVRSVRLILHDAGVIRLEYRHKRRGKWRNHRKSRANNRGFKPKKEAACSTV